MATPVKVDGVTLTRMWDAGVPTEEIVAHFGCTRPAVMKRARAMRLQPRPGQRLSVAQGKSGRPDWGEAGHMRRNGASIQEIAEFFGVSPAWTYARLRHVQVQEQREPEPERKAPPSIQHPFWTPARDSLIWATGGKHAAMASVAAALGKPIAEVQRRWHMLRAGA